jgi:hypothetical protein
MMEISLTDKVNIYKMTVSGVPTGDILKKYRIGPFRLERILSEMSKMKHHSDFNSILGHKNQPYYECEEEYTSMPSYDWNDLSLIEIEFYEGKNN